MGSSGRSFFKKDGRVVADGAFANFSLEFPWPHLLQREFGHPLQGPLRCGPSDISPPFSRLTRALTFRQRQILREAIPVRPRDRLDLASPRLQAVPADLFLKSTAKLSRRPSQDLLCPDVCRAPPERRRRSCALALRGGDPAPCQRDETSSGAARLPRAAWIRPCRPRWRASALTPSRAFMQLKTTLIAGHESARHLPQREPSLRLSLHRP